MNASLTENTGKVTTITENVPIGFPDGRAEKKRLGALGGIATDAKGNIYIGDKFNARICKVSRDGVQTTFAGNGVRGGADGPARKTDFTSPSGVAVGPKGNIYVLDGAPTLARIRKVSSEGRLRR